MYFEDFDLDMGWTLNEVEISQEEMLEYAESVAGMTENELIDTVKKSGSNIDRFIRKKC